jgi:hypothetical protein
MIHVSFESFGDSMSAENDLKMYRMSNGEFWIGNRACGDTIMEAWGDVHIVCKCPSYAKAAQRMNAMDDEDADSYVYTEHFSDVPSEEEVMADTLWFVGSNIRVRFSDRKCECFDERDLAQPLWRIEEHSLRCMRELAVGLTFAQAVTRANLFASAQPALDGLHLPQFFKKMVTYPKHSHKECRGNYWYQVQGQDLTLNDQVAPAYP